MKQRKLLIYFGFLLLVVSGCKKDLFPGGSCDPLKPYVVTEDFESGTKAAYAVGNVQLSTGLWSFDDALIGNLAADVKNGNKSVRIRGGSITMNFDIKGISQISIKHAKYGKDPASSWQLFISTDSGATFTPLGQTITDTSTTFVTDSFQVVSDAKARFRIKKVGVTTNRTNIDDITFKGMGDPGLVVGPPDTNPVDTAGTGNPGTDRGVTAGADAPPATGDNSNLLFGNPSNAQPVLAMGDNYLLDQKYYTESYSSSRGTPNWVSWHLDATNTTNASPRLDNFAGFNGLPASFFEVQSNSYQGSGFDRGHNCPSADRTSSANANSATFLMTNMIPQAPQNNQQTWANLENYLREQVVAGNEVYIIMGSYGSGGTGSNGSALTITSGHVTVPSNVWKVAVIVPTGDADVSRVTNTTRVIAVNTPNINAINSDWKQYRVTVRDIEKATGYNLLSNLAQNIQDVIETKKDNL